MNLFLIRLGKNLVQIIKYLSNFILYKKNVYMIH